MIRPLVFLSAALLATPVLAEDIACTGAFAIDTSEARLIETFGKDNVVTGEVPGPEGTTMIATRVFPDDPEREMRFVWWNEEARDTLSVVDLPLGDSVGGVKAGLTVAEVEALNGEPFTMTGFWWDYGGNSWFQSGRLAELEGDCIVSVSFAPPETIDEGLDVEPISGDREVSSSEPLLAEVDVRVERVSLGYPHPDFR